MPPAISYPPRHPHHMFTACLKFDILAFDRTPISTIFLESPKVRESSFRQSKGTCELLNAVLLNTVGHSKYIDDPFGNLNFVGSEYIRMLRLLHQHSSSQRLMTVVCFRSARVQPDVGERLRRNFGSSWLLSTIFANQLDIFIFLIYIRLIRTSSLSILD